MYSALFLSIYLYAFSLDILSKKNTNFLALKVKMKNYFMAYFTHTKKHLAEKWLHYFLNSFDVAFFILLIYVFMLNIDNWQAGVTLGIIIMFAILRGASLLEDIRLKKENRLRTRAEREQMEWEHKQKRKG